MLRSYSNTLAIIACLAAVSFSGCAQMFNSNLSELVSQPELQSDLPARTKADLNDIKIDPLILAANTAEASNIDSPDYKLVKELPALVENEESNVRTPIIHLEPLRKKPDNQFRPGNQTIPEQVIAKANNALQPIENPASNPKNEFVEANKISPAIPVFEPDESTLLAPNPITDLINTNSIKSLPAIPVAAVPEDKKVDIQAKNADVPVIMPLDVINDKFVSSQMKTSVPPFANHPIAAACDYASCSMEQSEDSIEVIVERGPNGPASISTMHALPFRTTDLVPESNAFVASTTRESTTNQNDFTPPQSNETVENDFVEKLISSTIDPNAFQMAATDLTQEVKYTNVSAVVETPVTWNSQLDNAILAFENEIQDPDVNANITELSRGLAILRSLKTSMAEGSDSNQKELEEYWLHQLKALNSIINSTDQSHPIGTTTAEALTHLNQAAYQLRESADLKLIEPAFCKKVAGYGQYVTFESTDFASDQRVLVYCEIENFTPVSALISENGVETFQTRISSSYEITNASNQIVQSTKFPTVTDNARKIRNDFFMHLPIQFADLKPGDYELQVEVRDHGSGKTAELQEPLKFKVR